MRSISILLPYLAVGFVAANAPSGPTVTVTSIRTHTVYPVTSPITCAKLSKSVFVGTGQDQAIGDEYASIWDHAKTEYNGQWDDWKNVVPTSLPTTTAGPKSSSTSWSIGTVSSTTTGPTSLSSVISNSTEVCNDNLNRSKWCNGKSIASDNTKNDYYTGVVRKYTFTITNTTLVFDGLVVCSHKSQDLV
ncbi:hypothetical protein PV10_01264 [Exophiala mesophila]|uniref:Secreted protein n=1 Tax=Exophiala mesophila TaxID=212818 RepID=A0A0D1X6S9_EXOME|nr:uncharacterized protein PV10_01264 [Exophiala mesophila]KIV97520.1 hypothetical protein PV10_01264 [Exophiala mesophila]